MRKLLLTWWRGPQLFCAALLLLGLLYHLSFLRTFSHWWFEDDPILFATIKETANPLSFFFDRSLILRISNALAPLQGVSLWVDAMLAYRSLRFTQIHHLLSLELTLLLLFCVLRNFGLKRGLSLVLCTVWLLLPATVVINEFISTRHYLEGFAWSLAAVLLAQKIKNSPVPPGRGIVFLLFACVSAAVVSKEIFSLTVPIVIGVYLYDRQRPVVAWGMCAVLAIYGVYRSAMLGTSIDFRVPFLDFAGYLRFLSRVPYLVVGNPAGYLLCFVVAAGQIYLWWKGQLANRTVLIFLLAAASALFAVYPVSYALSEGWMVHGTWYRAAFGIASGALLTLGLVLSRLRSNPLRHAILLLAAVSALWGGMITRDKWQVMMDRHKYEGKYYLRHPNRLLYSELPAFWFLPGVDRLYTLPRSHHISRAVGQLAPPARIEDFSTIYRYRDGKFVKDPALFAELLAKSQPAN